MSDCPAALSVANRHKSVGPLSVLKGISRSAHQGGVISTLNAGGAGKTTLLRCIIFLETLDSGTLTVGGEEVHMKTSRQSAGHRQFALLQPLRG
jgi:octopine/nopaline transport system ATP-binding protein